MGKSGNKTDIPRELKALKELLDMGAISQEEFEKRKMPLLETPEETKLREENEKKQTTYDELVKQLHAASEKKEYEILGMDFSALGNFLDALKHAAECREIVEKYNKEEAYEDAEKKIGSNDLEILKSGRASLEKSGRAAEAEQLMQAYQIKIAEKEEKVLLEKKKKRKKHMILFSAAALMIALLGGSFLSYKYFYIPWKADKNIYERAVELYENGQYPEAAAEFDKIPDFRDSAELSRSALELQEEILSAAYKEAESLLASGQYDEASKAFQDISGYSDADEMAIESIYQKGMGLLASGQYDEAAKVFQDISGYSDADDMAKESFYQKGMAVFQSADYEEAASIFKELETYSDSKEYYCSANAAMGDEYFEAENYENALAAYKKAGYRRIEQRYECDYILGKRSQENNQWTKAIVYYEDIPSSYSEYGDMKNAILECKYEFIQDNPKITKQYKGYLKDLYKNSTYKSKVSSIYNEIFAWNVDIYMVNTSEYETRNMTSISHLSPVYWHFRVTGGDGTFIKLKFRTKLPGCGWSECFNTYVANEDGCCSSYYTSYGSITSGSAQIAIYNEDTGEKLASDSVAMY